MGLNLNSEDIPWDFLQQVALKHPWANITKIAENNKNYIPLVNQLYLENTADSCIISSLIKAIAENKAHEQDNNIYNYDLIFFFEEHHRLVYLEGASIKYAAQLTWQTKRAFSEGIPEEILYKFYYSKQVAAYGKALRNGASQQVLKQIEEMNNHQAATYLKNLETDNDKSSEQTYYIAKLLNLYFPDLAGQTLEYIFGIEEQ